MFSSKARVFKISSLAKPPNGLTLKSSWMQLLTHSGLSKIVGISRLPGCYPRAITLRSIIARRNISRLRTYGYVFALSILVVLLSRVNPHCELFFFRSSTDCFAFFICGERVSGKLYRLPFWYGDEGDRTPDPLLAKQVLSQLSYIPRSKATVISKIADGRTWIRTKDLSFIRAAL